jgi:hypothetical protein
MTAITVEETLSVRDIQAHLLLAGARARLDQLERALVTGISPGSASPASGPRAARRRPAAAASHPALGRAAGTA